jgi:hypothetical protein
MQIFIGVAIIHRCCPRELVQRRRHRFAGPPRLCTGKRAAQEDDSVRDLISTTDSAKRNLGNQQKSSFDLLPSGIAGNPAVSSCHLTEYFF